MDGGRYAWAALQRGGWGPKCGTGRVCFWAKNGDASANVAEKIADSLLSWAIYSDCSVRDLAMGQTELFWVQTDTFLGQTERFWGCF